MKSIFVFFVFFAFILMVSYVNSYPTFSEYVVEYNKNYNKTEYVMREKTYNEEVASFKDFTLYTPAINNLTDWTSEEIDGIFVLKFRIDKRV
jgi:hypothetical protein